ncbi:MAG: hypothetical protein PHU49_03715 [Syntrophorhabdaceae bacterium]|jgi:hypothetical protein|nr:hypothetical protein [Syntrophorhabdaceae bacterium]
MPSKEQAKKDDEVLDLDPHGEELTEGDGPYAERDHVGSEEKADDHDGNIENLEISQKSAVRWGNHQD